MAEDPKKCPCKQELTSGQKDVLNFGLSNQILTNPNAEAVNAARQLGGSNSARIESILQSAGIGGAGGGAGGAGGGVNALATAIPSLNRMKSQLDRQAGIVDAFSAEAERLSTPQGLLSTVSSLNFFSEMNCALGIEGIDVMVGLNVVNQNGQFAIQGAVSANVNLEKVLNQFGEAGAATADGIKKLQAGLNDAFQKMDEANSKIDEVVSAAQGMQNQAADFIQKYTSISALADLVNEANIDPCFKMRNVVNGGLISPQFINAVRGANVGSVFR